MRRLIVLMAAMMIAGVSCAATFGETGTSTDWLQKGSTIMVLSSFTVTSAGDVTKLTAYCKSSATTKNAKGVIYSAAVSSQTPSILLGVSSPVALTTTASSVDFTFATSVSITPGVYWIGVLSGGDDVLIAYLSTDPKIFRQAIMNYTTPTNYVSDMYTDYATHLCIYATYTPSAASVTYSIPKVFEW